jgi:hypothetical protein
MLQQAVSDNNAECGASHDPGFANNVLHWQTVAGDLDLATAPNGLDRASVLAGLCLTITSLTVSYPIPRSSGSRTAWTCRRKCRSHHVHSRLPLPPGGRASSLRYEKGRELSANAISPGERVTRVTGESACDP